MPPPPMPKSLERKICRMGRALVPHFEIAQATGKSISTVNLTLRQNGIKSRRQTLYERRLKTVREAIQDGGTFAEISERTGISHSGVYALARTPRGKHAR